MNHDRSYDREIMIDRTTDQLTKDEQDGSLGSSKNIITYKLAYKTVFVCFFNFKGIIWKFFFGGGVGIKLTAQESLIFRKIRFWFH